MGQVPLLMYTHGKMLERIGGDKIRILQIYRMEEVEDDL